MGDFVYCIGGVLMFALMLAYARSLNSV